MRYRFARVGAIAGALVLASASVAYAADTPTLGPNGDCWKSGTPYWCRTHWSGVSTSVTFQAIDQFSSQRPAWLSLAQTAVGNWSGAAGPQVYTWSSSSNYNKIYLVYSSTGSHGLTSVAGAVTWNCNAAGNCNDTNNQAGWTIDYSDIYLNHNVLDGETTAHITNTFAHESGHAMGLFHNPSSSSLMYMYMTNIVAPTSSDIGAFPGCSSSGHGIRCVYGSGD